mmetsp:Transcript_46513/g.72799  ORF Transcript_46513/g.72799 Transcript_46513/m.72799 type:complete len:150 (-) Transcript_46513:75-524(-)
MLLMSDIDNQVVGYNPLVASEIRTLRKQLGSVAHVYGADNGLLKREIRSSEVRMKDLEEQLTKADIDRKDKVEKLEKLQRERDQLRELVDENIKLLKEQQRLRMRKDLQLETDTGTAADMTNKPGTQYSVGIGSQVHSNPNSRPPTQAS